MNVYHRVMFDITSGTVPVCRNTGYLRASTRGAIRSAPVPRTDGMNSELRVASWRELR